MSTPDHDELLSAHLDGLTTPEEAQRIAADPELSARADAMRSATQLAATPVVGVDDHVVDAAVATALAHSTTTATNVTALAGSGRRRQRRLAAIGAAAAVIAIGFLAGAVILSLDGDESADDLAASDATSEQPETATELSQGDAAPAERTEDVPAEEAGGATPDQDVDDAQEESVDESLLEAEADGTDSFDGEVADDSASAADSPAADADGSEDRLFESVEDLVEAIQAETVEPRIDAPALPCGALLKEAGEGESPAVLFARLPDSRVLVTGVVGASGFVVDSILRIDDCTEIPMPSP